MVFNGVGLQDVLGVLTISSETEFLESKLHCHASVTAGHDWQLQIWDARQAREGPRIDFKLWESGSLGYRSFRVCHLRL